VSDIFSEVDEEVRRERLQKLWDRWGWAIMALAVVVVLAIAGWRGWQWWEAKRAAEAGAAFDAALTLSESGKHQDAEAALDKIAADSPSGYRTLARFREAAELATRDRQAAVKTYDALAADGRIGRTLQDLAAVRAGLLLVDTAPLNELQTRLESLTAAERPFRHTARELLALAAWRTGEVATARRWFDLIMTDTETPTGTRGRIEMLIALAQADGKG
jgi:hypothetical protein